MISAVTGGVVTVAGALVIGLALPAFVRYRFKADSATGADQGGLDGQEPESEGQGPEPAEAAPTPAPA